MRHDTNATKRPETQTSASLEVLLAQHYAAQGLAPDGGLSESSWQPLKSVAIRLPQFEWRRRALLRHDLHHIATGYPCTVQGEMQMAAWEYAAGRFRNTAATMACLPLLALGALCIPSKSFSAFVLGRKSKTLYGAPLPALDAHDLQSLRALMLPAMPPAPRWRDRIAYAGLCLLAAPLMVCALPFAALLSRGKAQ